MSLLALDHVGKSFGAIHALTDVSFQVAPGEVVGLMGDNGAGKSTLVKLIAGNFPPSSGWMFFADKPAHFDRPVEARAAGIEVVYQDLALADNLSAAANVFLGRELKRGFGPIRLLDHAAMARRAQALFAELKSETRASELVRQMSGGQLGAAIRCVVARPAGALWPAHHLLQPFRAMAKGRCMGPADGRHHRRARWRHPDDRQHLPSRPPTGRDGKKGVQITVSVDHAAGSRPRSTSSSTRKAFRSGSA